MIQNLKRIIQLECGFQNYEWGKIGKQSAVYNLVCQNQQNLDLNKPYAELWMGTHPNLPSYAIIDGNKVKLNDLIQQNPSFYLGEQTINQFQTQDQLPFLFKVLSVNKALSIQAHPDKSLAKILNQQFPQIYKDDNYKPEMCIALTKYEALCTFCDKEQLIKNLENIPEIFNLLDNNILNQFKNENNPEILKKLLKSLFSQLFALDDQIVKSNIQQILDRINSKKYKNERDLLMHKLQKQYPYDVGILVSNFLNYFVINPGDALVMNANDPHAYLEGNCIECMANSDNVVRAGLTPKFKDIKTLTEMLTYNMGPPPLFQGEVIKQGENFQILQFNSSYKEFKSYQIKIIGNIKKTASIKSQCPYILLIVEGDGLLQSKDENINFQKGSTFYIVPNSEFYLQSKGPVSAFLCGPEDPNIKFSD